MRRILQLDVDLALPFAFNCSNLPFANTIKTGYGGWRKDRKFWVFNSFALGGAGGKPMPLSELFCPGKILAIL